MGYNLLLATPSIDRVGVKYIVGPLFTTFGIVIAAVEITCFYYSTVSGTELKVMQIKERSPGIRVEA